MQKKVLWYLKNTNDKVASLRHWNSMQLRPNYYTSLHYIMVGTRPNAINGYSKENNLFLIYAFFLNHHLLCLVTCNETTV